MNTRIKYMVSLFGLLALFSCNKTELLLNTAVIVKPQSGSTSILEISALLPTEAIYVCSLGPYFSSMMMVDEFYKSMIATPEYSSIPEYEGHFVYYDENLNLIQTDIFYLNKGNFRWQKSADGATSRCAEVQSASIRVSDYTDHYKIGLE
jgi:hypothetical protein